MSYEPVNLMDGVTHSALRCLPTSSLTNALHRFAFQN
jgi:hypothetical protein